VQVPSNALAATSQGLSPQAHQLRNQCHSQTGYHTNAAICGINYTLPSGLSRSNYLNASKDTTPQSFTCPFEQHSQRQSLNPFFLNSKLKGLLNYKTWQLIYSLKNTPAVALLQCDFPSIKLLQQVREYTQTMTQTMQHAQV